LGGFLSLIYKKEQQMLSHTDTRRLHLAQRLETIALKNMVQTIETHDTIFQEDLDWLKFSIEFQRYFISKGHENQQRIPAGQEGGGRWTNGNSGWSGEGSLGQDIQIPSTNEDILSGSEKPKTIDTANISSHAKDFIGSKDWSYNSINGPYGVGTNKCNLFVDDVLRTYDIAPPYVSRGYFRDALDAGLYFNLPGRPILAGEWANRNFDILNWDIVTSPQVGDVAAYAKNYSDASGHVGIIGYDEEKGGFTLISASSL
jgi:hypothetical protein